MNYFFDLDQIRVPYTTEFASSLTAGTPKHHSINEDGKIQKQHAYIQHPIGAVPKDVLQMTLNQKEDKSITSNKRFYTRWVTRMGLLARFGSSQLCWD